MDVVEKVAPQSITYGPPVPTVLALPWPKKKSNLEKMVDNYTDGVVESIQRRFRSMGIEPPTPSVIRKSIEKQVDAYRRAFLR